jgi:hypothetical protein
MLTEMKNLFVIFITFATWRCLCFDHRIPRLAIDYGPRLVGLATYDRFSGVKPTVTLKNNGDLTVVVDEIIQNVKAVGAREIILGEILFSVQSHLLFFLIFLRKFFAHCFCKL